MVVKCYVIQSISYIPNVCIENICLCIIMTKFSDACCIGLPCYRTKVTVTFQGIGFSNNENFLYTFFNVGSERLFEGLIPRVRILNYAYSAIITTICIVFIRQYQTS